MKVLIAAGGTGGHIYPGIAVANEVMARFPASEVLFVGTARGLETKIVPDSGFQLVLINSAGLKNVGFVGKLKGAIVLPRSFWEARKILKEFKPDVVVGAGGYVSGPVLLSAHFMKFPTVVMDSNAMPGFTNRILAKYVDKAALTFDAALPYFPGKGVVTGNPVREEFFSVGRRQPAEPLHILVFGGSQGARAINDAVIAAIPLLGADSARLKITHQTGEGNYEAVRSAYMNNEVTGVEVRPYISNMVEAFEKADLIISRAGATTCAEVTAAGRAAIMIPFPGAADDHQRKNAEALVEKGAAVMILQKDLSAVRLAEDIRAFINAPTRITAMASAAKRLARPDAASATVDLMSELLKKQSINNVSTR
jgi:UDP-N-acetylglucosamine--N-acetylmuramyl-(pentapeptide) pyrophosphoryl-undecaprenol N-acetylglucosamine transferase